MHDISDPSGAGRGDRKQARRLVDDAYAAGWISAIDRSLRVEQIDAASTRGDLAMIVRDLAGDPPASQQPTPSAPSSTPPPAPQSGPAPAEQVPQWPGAPSPATQETAPTSPGASESAPASWPPPSFTPGPALGGTGAPPASSGTNKKVIGCLVAFVLFIFLGPCLLGIATIGIAAFTSDGFSSSSEVGDLEPVGGTYGDGYTWDDLYWGLEGTVGTTQVKSLSADAASATAVVEEAGVQTTWTWQDGEWSRTQTGGSSGGPTSVDLSEISDAVLQSAIDRVRGEQALTGIGSTMFDIDAFAGAPRITMTVSADNGSGTGTYLLDELG